MKKTLLFIMALLLSAGVEATVKKQLDLISLTIGWDASYTSGTITFTGEYGGAAGWTAWDARFNHYNKAVVKFEELTAAVKLRINYKATSSATDWNTQIEADAAIGDTEVSLDFPTTLYQIGSIYVVCPTTGTTVTLTDAYLEGPNQLSFDLKNLNSGYNSSYDSSTNTITFDEGWKARGWSLDVAAWKTVVAEFDAVDYPVALQIYYNTSENNDLHVETNVQPGATKISLKVPSAAVEITKVYLVNWNARSSELSKQTLKLNAAYATAEDFCFLDLANLNAEWGTDTEEGSYDVSTKTITYNAAWKGRGWNLSKTDLATYKTVVIEFGAATTFAHNLYLYYKATEGAANSDIHTEIKAGATKAAISIPSGIYSIESIILNNGAIGTQTLSDAYLTNEVIALNTDVTPTLATTSPTTIILNHPMSNGWTTLCLPFDTNVSVFGEDAKAYTLTSYASNTMTLTKVSDGALTAGTPYLVNCTSDKPGIITFENTAITNTTAGTGNTVGGFTLTGNYTYGFDMNNKYGIAWTGSAWQIIKGAEGAKLKAFCAYFDGTPSAARINIIVDDEETTGVSDISSKAPEMRNEYYDLSGRRVAQPTKGLYIVNGKKVVIK